MSCDAETDKEDGFNEFQHQHDSKVRIENKECQMMQFNKLKKIKELNKDQKIELERLRKCLSEFP